MVNTMKNKLSTKNTFRQTTLIGYAFIAPAVILMAIFLVYPIVEALRLSLYNSTLKETTFVGLDNFVKLFHDDLFLKCLSNTIKYVVIIVPVVVLLSLYVASIISKKKPWKTSMYRGLFYLPTIASAVTVSVVWNWIFNPVIGVANYLIGEMGGKPVMWFSGSETAFYCVVLVSVVCSVGQPIILYSAAIGGISSEYYEAAALDGASDWQQFVRITIPMLKPTTLYILVITSINAFQIFIPVQMLTGGGPVNSTTSLIYELYRTAFQYRNFGYASAMGVILFIILGILAMLQFRLMNDDKGG